MKLTCEYCESLVDISDVMTCPRCGAPMGEAYRAAVEKQKREEEEKAALEAQKQKEQQEAEQNSRILNTVLGAAGVAAGSLFGRGIGSTVSRLSRGYSKSGTFSPTGNSGRFGGRGPGGPGGFGGPGGPKGPGGRR